jgi:hypothetical protein
MDAARYESLREWAQECIVPIAREQHYSYQLDKTKRTLSDAELLSGLLSFYFDIYYQQHSKQT